jgi:hypothetical protein
MVPSPARALRRRLRLRGALRSRVTRARAGLPDASALRASHARRRYFARREARCRPRDAARAQHRTLTAFCGGALQQCASEPRRARARAAGRRGGACVEAVGQSYRPCSAEKCRSRLPVLRVFSRAPAKPVSGAPCLRVASAPPSQPRHVRVASTRAPVRAHARPPAAPLAARRAARTRASRFCAASHPALTARRATHARAHPSREPTARGPARLARPLPTHRTHAPSLMPCRAAYKKPSLRGLVSICACPGPFSCAARGGRGTQRSR